MQLTIIYETALLQNIITSYICTKQTNFKRQDTFSFDPTVKFRLSSAFFNDEWYEKDAESAVIEPLLGHVGSNPWLHPLSGSGLIWAYSKTRSADVIWTYHEEQKLEQI